MTAARPATRAPKRPVRNKKRAPARPTAHIGYQPAGLNAWGRRVKERYHALTDRVATIGFITRHPGDALCGTAGPWADLPDGLFPPLVTCPTCTHIAARQHITILGGSQ